jgi:hypothetical protein
VVAGATAIGAALSIWLGKAEIADCERAGYSDCASDGILYFLVAVAFALVGLVPRSWQSSRGQLDGARTRRNED